MGLKNLGRECGKGGRFEDKWEVLGEVITKETFRKGFRRHLFLNKGGVPGES